MNPIIKNLIHVIRRFKLAALLNILGLSVAFAAFMVIMMQLQFNFGFDRFHKDYDKIFRVEMNPAGESYQAILPRPLAEAIFRSSPHILSGAIVNPWARQTFFQVETNGVSNYFRENRISATPEFTDIFTFDFVEGSGDALKTDRAMIPLSLARRLFGNESALGRHITSVGNNQSIEVGAVYRDFPANSIIENAVYTLFPPEHDIDNWGEWSYITYIRVNDASNVSILFENFKRTFDTSNAPAWFQDMRNWEESGASIRFTALPDIHFTTDVRWDNAPKANRQALLILFAIGIVIIVIASINFTNFSTALSPMRVRKINTQRVLGAQQSTIRFILIFEAVAFSLVSYGIALLLVKIFGDSQLANLITAEVSLSAQQLVVFGTALVALLVGVLAGMYPARYMTSFAPALALKGNFALSPKGKQLRNTLIGIQYIASFALIIGASFMYLQNRFMQNADLGFNRDALIIANIWRIQEHRDAVVHQLKTHSTIENVTFSEALLSSQDQYMGWGRGYKGEQINFQVLPVHYNFLQIMGIEITEGRHFRQDDTETQYGTFIFNETARRQFGLEVNSSVDGIEIVGFMPDVKFASFRMAVEPMAFHVWGTQFNRPPNQAYIQLTPGASLRDAMAHVRTTLAEFDPNYPFVVRFFDEVLQRTYESERKLSRLILLFSLIAILISIVGVFGLVVFDSECRRKEIGIRKVLGSSTGGIILMFNKAYFKILTICFVIAVPIAWFAVSRWLENFAYRTPMYWWVFALAFVAVAAITVLTVTVQNWRVANDDPVRSIKTE